MALRRLVVSFALVLAALPASCPVPAALGATPERPNIVLLIGDDHGWPYSGFMGDPIAKTPNLDALAAGGTLFTDAQSTSSVCVPSLRALLAAIHTDQWDAHTAAIDAMLGPQPFRSEVAHLWTVPRALAWQGYVSWEGGKLWEGTYAQAGFSQGMATVPGTWFTSVGDHFGRDGWEDGSALDPLRGFLDTVGDRPFFTWIAPLIPHYPYDAPAEFQSQYDHLGLTVNEAGYYANISWLDALAGAIVAELDARGLRDNTLIVYLSDNGLGIDQPIAGVGQGKGTLAELGFRTPLILNWPGHVQAGVVRDDLVSELDVPATILDFAGAEPIVSGGGRSLKPAVETGTAAGRDQIVGHYVGNLPENTGYFVRTQTWRYIAVADGTEEIYAIASDPFEEVDVADLHPDLLPGFQADIADWQAAITRAPDELEAAGRLTDAAGAPLGGQPLQLVGRSAAGVKLRLDVITGPNGDFRFVALPQGSYVLRSPSQLPLSLGPYSGEIPVALPFGGLDQYLPVQAAPPAASTAAGTATIRGVLRDAGGHPLGARAVVVRRAAQPTVDVVVRTAADGRYRAENLPPGIYRLTATAGPHLSRPRGRVRVGANADVQLDLTAIAL